MEDYKELISLCDYWIGLSDENDKKTMTDQLLNRCKCAIEHLIEERDAMLADLKEYASCDYCKHSNSECDEYWAIGEMGLSGLCNGEHFEWRGVQE